VKSLSSNYRNTFKKKSIGLETNFGVNHFQGVIMSLRTQIEAAPENFVQEATDESYMTGILVIAKSFLRELDKMGDDWKPQNESSSQLGAELYPKCPELKGKGFSGNQVAEAAHLAYQAWEQS
jgi:hypothetical protein